LEVTVADISKEERFDDWVGANHEHYSESAGGYIALRRSMVRALFEACEASWQLGHKVYHNANAHEAAPNWQKVRDLLKDAFGDYEP
jgi:hypothetical protein